MSKEFVKRELAPTLEVIDVNEFRCSDGQLPVDVPTLYRQLNSTEGRFGDAVSYAGMVRGTSLLPMAMEDHTVAKLYLARKGLASAIIAAYSNHSTLVLRPDDIWLAIIAGAAQHISLHAEEYRNVLVNHSGKVDLEVWIDDVWNGTTPADGIHAPVDKSKGWCWEVGVRRLCTLIQKNTKQDVVSLFRTAFNTTDATSEVASLVPCMGALKEYFTYTMRTRCGIRSVEMHGTEEDWAALSLKALELRKLLLTPDNSECTRAAEEWIDHHLMPVLGNLLKTYKGDSMPAIVEWWSHIVDAEQPFRSGQSTTYNGWFRDLFMYAANKRLMPPTSQKITLDQLPTSQCEVPFVFNNAGAKHACKLQSGHSGFFLRMSDGAVVPIVTWAVLQDKVLSSNLQEE